MMQGENPLALASFTRQRTRTQGVKRALARNMPKPLKRGLRFIADVSLDGVDLLVRRRRDLVPPRRLNFVGDGDFERTGNEFQGYFIGLGGLMSHHKVLEIGCGIGRMARPLTRYLVSGSYDGIDIVPPGIKWCRRNITKRYPNFRFHVADVHNRQYNPRGTVDACRYRFPFGDDEFDFIFLTSVFTHMLKPEMTNYCHEIHRMLRPSGRCLVTFFLLNEESCTLSRGGKSSLLFSVPEGECWLIDKRAPNDAVAYEEEFLRSYFRNVGLQVDAVHYGAWCGRSTYLSYQDIVLAQKR